MVGSANDKKLMLRVSLEKSFLRRPSAEGPGIPGWGATRERGKGHRRSDRALGGFHDNFVEGPSRDTISVIRVFDSRGRPL